MNNNIEFASLKGIFIYKKSWLKLTIDIFVYQLYE